MTDIDELLSELTDSLKPQGELRPLCVKAADSIARMRKALEWYANHKNYRSNFIFAEMCAHWASCGLPFWGWLPAA